jgi:NADH-quinone oxidoreductase subunit E
VARYPRARSALLPMLHLVQADEGYVSPDGIALCAEELGLTKAEVGAVATFYTMYKRRPAGDWLVSVCTNTVCGILGGDAIFTTLSEQLGVGHDETTADGTITLEHAECLAACDYAPVVTVNYEFFDRQTPESSVRLVDALRNGERPLPTRGAPLCPLAEMSLQLAGFPDEREDAAAAGPAGEPTLIGARLAVERRETAPPYPDGSPGARAASASEDGWKEAAAVGAAPPADGSAPEPSTPPGAPAEAAGARGAVREQPSAHDAPQSTSASDSEADPGKED